jgi:hypothetical protein
MEQEHRLLHEDGGSEDLLNNKVMHDRMSGFYSYITLKRDGKELGIFFLT